MDFLPLISGSLITIAIIIALIIKAKKDKASRELAEQDRIKKLTERIEKLCHENKIFEGSKVTLLEKIKTSKDQKTLDNLIKLHVDYKTKNDLLLNKYGEEIGQMLFDGKMWIGMTKEQLKDSKGEPDKIDIEHLKTKSKETWIYGNKSSGDYIVFENDIATKVVDR